MFNLLPFIFNKKSVSKIDNKNDEPNEYIIIDKNFENNECIICLEAMLIDDKVRILKCGHMYHYLNYSKNKKSYKWIYKKGELNCPICFK